MPANPARALAIVALCLMPLSIIVIVRGAGRGDNDNELWMLTLNCGLQGILGIVAFVLGALAPRGKSNMFPMLGGILSLVTAVSSWAIGAGMIVAATFADLGPLR